VESVFVQDQRVCERADLQQPVPVGAVASQPRNLQPHHDAGLAQSHIGHQSLKALSLRRRGPRLSLVLVDDHDALLRPAQGERASTQRILALGALGVLEDLPQGGLTDVKVSRAFEMLSSNFRFGIHRAEQSDKWAEVICASNSVSCRWQSGKQASGEAAQEAGPEEEPSGQQRIQGATPWRKSNTNPSGSAVRL